VHEIILLCHQIILLCHPGQAMRSIARAGTHETPDLQADVERADRWVPGLAALARHDNRSRGAHMSINLNQASTIVDSALKKGRETNCAPLTVAVLDAGGHLVAFKREDKSGILRFDIAYGKAWGALGMGFGSRELAD